MNGPMIATAIFIFHAVLASFVGYRERKEGANGIVLGIAMVVLLFAIGWTLSTFLTTLVWPERGVGLFIDDWNDTALKRFLYREATTDTASLLLLSAGEAAFYNWYLRKEPDRREHPKEGGVSGV